MGCSGLIRDGNIKSEKMPFLYASRSSTIAGGRMMVRKAALVLGSLMISFPPTGWTCLLIRSFPVFSFRSSHRRARIHPGAGT